MSKILSLAVRVTGDASRLNLTPVERALKGLEAETEKVGKVFTKFASESEAGAKAQKEFADRSSELRDALKSGVITAQEFADSFAKISEEAKAEADALDRAAKLSARFEPEVKKFTRAQEDLNEQLRKGRIDQDVYNAALEEAARNLTDAERAAAGLAARTAEVADAGKSSTLRFNELSGVFAILPGPLGSIAGRISGITSASEGLSRVFAGGLSQGISSVAGSITSLVNPFTAAAAAIVGLGAAAQQVVSGLVRLEDRVERLGNLANQLGVSFGFVQVLEEAGNRTGVSVQQLEGAFARLQNTLASGGEESKKAADALSRLGISVEQLQDLTQEQRIELFGKQIAAIENPAQRSAAAIALFGRSGVQLLPFFNQIGAAADDVAKFNAQISDLDRTRIDELGTAFDGLNVAIRGFGQELLTPFIGITRSITETLSPTITTLGQNLGALFDAISPITSGLGLLINVVGQVGATLSRIIGTALEPAAAVGRLISGVYDRVSQTFTQVFAAINRVVDGFRNFLRFEGAITAIGNVTSRVSQIFTDLASAIAERVSPAFEFLGNVISRLSAIFERLQELFAAAAQGILGRIAGLVGKFLEFTGVSRVVQTVIDGIGTVLEFVGDIISRVAGAVGGFIDSALDFAERWLGISRVIQEPVVATIELDTGTALAELIAENKELGKVLDNITQSVSNAIDESAAFGEAGFEAALKYQQSIDDLKEKLAAGLFNETTFKVEAEKARLAFKGELDRISEESRLEIQIEQNAAREIDNLRRQISDVIDDAARFGEAGFDAALQFQTSLEELQRQFEAGVINEEVLSREVKKARAEYEGITKLIEEASRAQRQQIDQDQRRIDSLLQVNAAAQKITEDITAVDREIARVQEQLTAAIGELDIASAEAARRRIEELEGLQQRLGRDLQAASQGFEQGFDAAFTRVGQRFNTLNDQAAEFGNAGAEAAERLREGIEEAQRQAEAGILNREAFEQEVQRQEQLFQKELENVREIANERQRVNELVDSRFALARFGGDQQRLQAAKNLEAIEREISRVQADIRKARAAGDNEGAAAGAARLAQLDQVAAQEEAIASGRKQLEEEIAKQREEALKNLERQQQQIQQQQQKAREEQAKAAEAEFTRQRDRIRDLNRLGAGVIQGVDLRSGDGAALFQQLTANAQDPQLIESRLQSRRLGELVNLVGQLTGLPIRTIGALGVG
jgi:hypothetical protein